jgi:hypothetical protein
MKLLAVDLGYSSVKIAYYNEEGVLQFDKYISSVAKLDTKPEQTDDDVVFRLGTDYYILGPSALKVSRNALLNLENFEDMKVAYPVWISYLLKKYGKFDKVIIGLSMAFTERANELLKYLYDTLMIQEENYFICLPQGLSCKVGYKEFGNDLREVSTKNDQRLRNYLIVDGGFLTLDVSQVVNGTASAGSTIGVPDTGVIFIARKVMEYLFKEYQMRISSFEAKTIIDNGGEFTRRGRVLNIGDKIIEFTKEYIKEVLEFLEKNFGDSIDSIEGILVCGGLAYFFKRLIDDPDVIQEIEKHFPISFLHFPKDDCEYYNCVSYLKIAEQKLK